MSRRSLGLRTLPYPTPVLLVGTYDADGQPNIMTAAWGGICCSRPPCISVSLSAVTYTHGAILAGECYKVSIPSEALIREADYAGMVSGRAGNKFDALGLTASPAEHVHAPYMAECRVVNTVELGSHTLFVGEVLDAYVDEDVLREYGVPDIGQIKPALFDTAGREYYGMGAEPGRALPVGKRL